MTRPQRLSAPQIEAVQVVVAAALAVLLVGIFGKRTQIAPAMGIAFVIVIGELAFAQSRARADQLAAEVAELQRVVSQRRAVDLRDRHETVDEPLPPPTEDRPTVVTTSVPAPLRQFIARDAQQDEAQCPTCGRFLVDVDPGATSSYRCRACATTWQWRRGTPWPDVHVIPNLGRLHRN